MLGLAFAIIILILAFGSVLAMGLPVGNALFGIGIGVSIITLLTNVLPVPDFTTFIGVMIGLGVGIDYALFIVTRYREQLHAGHDPRESIGIAIDTAGRAVLFAGTTVVISLLGMLLMGVEFVQGLAVGAAAVVAVTMVASLTLLPALLGFAGHRIEVTRWRGLIAAMLIALGLVGVGLARARAARWRSRRPGRPDRRVLRERAEARGPPPAAEAAPSRPPPTGGAASIQRRPWPPRSRRARAAPARHPGAQPAPRASPTRATSPSDTTTRKAYDLLVEGFGPGFNGPLLLVAELPDGTDVAAASTPVTEAVERRPGRRVRLARPAERPERPDGRWSGTSCPRRHRRTRRRQSSSTASAATCCRRSSSRPASTSLVTGSVAVNVDFSSYLAARMPYFFGAVLGAVVPAVDGRVPFAARAAEGGDHEPAVDRRRLRRARDAASSGDGSSDLIGIQPGPIEPFMPMMLFAIVFGLSMDYEVFLLSRIREEWDRTGDSRRSVADGLAATAKVITAAAAIMVVVFGSFLLEIDRVAQADGRRLGDGDPPRRHRRPHGARARDDGAARRQELVAAALARPHPAEHRRRGPRRARDRRRRARTRASRRRRQLSRLAEAARRSTHRDPRAAARRQPARSTSSR